MSESQGMLFGSLHSEPLAKPKPPPERPRRDGQREAILQRLQQGEATSDELNEICFRYSARIFELRKAGYQIEKRRISAGVFGYQLKGE